MKIKEATEIVYLETESSGNFIRIDKDRWFQQWGDCFEYYFDPEEVEEIYQNFVETEEKKRWSRIV